MLIAFEGPDETGKSTSALNLSHDGHPIYNATKANHAAAAADTETDLVQTFDRIDWLTHMAYRLAMPDRDWNDDRPRTVFAMPDTHLVFRMHAQEQAAKIDAVGEGYRAGQLADVTEMYATVIDWLLFANQVQQYRLFKTISVVHVDNDQAGGYAQHLALFSSPLSDPMETPGVTSDSELLELLRHEDQHRL